MFVSDAFKGSMSDNDNVKKSGFLSRPWIYNNRHAVCERSRSEHPTISSRKEQANSGEEITTKQTARVRIHVERAIERIQNSDC